MSLTKAPGPLFTSHTPGLDLTANASPRVIAVSVVLLLITAVTVTLRFVSRWVSKAGMWWDDWMILAAMFVSWGCPILALYATHFGFGKHIEAEGDIPARLHAASEWFKIFYIFETFYTVALALTKYSIILFYSRIFKTFYFNLSLWLTAGLVTAWFIAIELAVLTECVPIHALWDFGPARCIDLPKFFLGSGIPNIALNIIILVLPLPMIWTLKIDRSQRAALSCVFLLGSFVVVVSILRIVVLSQLELVDITWSFVDAGIWTAVEPCIAVASACLPILRSLWIRSRLASPTVKSTRKSMKSGTSMRSSRPNDNDIGSFTSHSHLNELSAENELPWGNYVSIYATHRRSNNIDDIEMDQRDIPANASRVKNQVSWLDNAGRLKGHRNNAAELSA